MIHDVLLSLLNPNSQCIAIEDMMASDAIATYLHPCEKKILEQIVKIIHQHREIATFTRLNGVNTKPSGSNDITDSLQKGLYLQALASGIDNVLQKYLNCIANLEKSYLQNPSHSLLFIFHKINIFQPLFSFLLKIVRDVKTLRLHGCMILQYLHQNMLHGDNFINRAAIMIQSAVNVVFLKQLTNWLLYGKVIDTYGEFFVQCSETKNTTAGSTSVGSGKQTLSDATSTYADIWHYEICYEFLPHYLSPAWAEKVLFIGQTVLMFKSGATKNKKDRIGVGWNELDKPNFGGSLYDDREHMFFKKIQDLQNDSRLSVARYENLIDEIKLHVTERLSQIAVDQADLVRQLKLIKDFFLLGRGELFLEFIKRTHAVERSPVTDGTVRDLVKAFDLAAHSVNVLEDLEQFTFSVPKERIDNSETDRFGYLQYITLQYKINWPLHLLFSPKVIDRYNELFRFLMLIKRTQYDLHMIWFHHRNTKPPETDVNILQLRNQLMFLIDNLQCYILIDVLESQFSILMNTVLSSSDFEHIQKSHSIFQANILSLCFLLVEEDPSKSGVITNIENPVLSILNKVFHLCEEFCKFAKTAKMPLIDSGIDDYNMLQREFETLIEKLLSLLINLKAGSAFTPLSQFLLRLDYNHWFSTRKEVKTT